MNPICRLKNWDLHDKKVLLRADLNVAIKDGYVSNDYRLQALLPTIDYIQNHGGKVIIITHMGRPKKPTALLSTQLLIPLFEKRGYKITFCKDIETAYTQSLSDPKTMLLLENLRFFPGEKTGDIHFAKQLSQLGDFYINDAFGTVHRQDTSITLVAQQFARDKRSIGLLIEKELETLNILNKSPEQPFVLILGGGKVADKIPLLEHLIHKVQEILLCPAIAFTFLKAKDNTPMGKSLVDNNAISWCKVLLDKAKKNKVTIHFPLDYQVALDTIDGKLINVNADNIPENAIGISIGPKTIEYFSKKIMNAQTIFFNAAMGFEYRKETMNGTYALLQVIAGSQGFSVVGGGDSVAAAQAIGVDKNIDFLSTGGGATLAYLSGQQLPGLVALE